MTVQDTHAVAEPIEAPDLRIRERRRAIALLGLIFIVALSARMFGLTSHSFWADEIVSLQLASGRPIAVFTLPPDQIIPSPPNVTASAEALPVSAMLRSLRYDTHPPLYLLTLRLWRSTFGDGDASCRSLSLVCSLAALLLLFDAVRIVHGATIALWPALIFALATPQIEYAQETRSYAMLAMWTLASIDSLVRLERSTNRRDQVLWSVALAFSLCAGALTHYYGFAPIAASGVYTLIRLRNKKLVCAVSAIAVACASFAVICGPLLVAQRANFHNNMTWISDDPNGLAWRTAKRIALLPLRFLITPMPSTLESITARLSIVMLFVPLLMLRRRPAMLIWCAFYLAAIALPAYADLHNSSQAINKIRYTLPAAAPLYAAACATLLHRHGVLRHLIPASLAFACLVAIPEAYQQAWKPDWRGLSEEICEKSNPTDVFVFYQIDANDWYQPLLHAGLSHYATFAKHPLLIVTKPPDEKLRNALARSSGVWIFSGDRNPPIERFIPGARGVASIANPFVGQGIKLELE